VSGTSYVNIPVALSLRITVFLTLDLGAIVYKSYRVLQLLTISEFLQSTLSPPRCCWLHSFALLRSKSINNSESRKNRLGRIDWIKSAIVSNCSALVLSESESKTNTESEHIRLRQSTAAQDAPILRASTAASTAETRPAPRSIRRYGYARRCHRCCGPTTVRPDIYIVVAALGGLARRDV
jgi:hypothetical protein